MQEFIIWITLPTVTIILIYIKSQDPYHGPSQAMGLSFSVPEGIRVPSSLVNIYKELQQDMNCSIPSHGNLERWAVQVTSTSVADIHVSYVFCFCFILVTSSTW